MTRRELVERIRAAAEPLYGEREAASIARLVAEKRWGLSRADCALEPLRRVDPGEGFDSLLADIAAARPVQYILGRADFDGLELVVGEGVLIPRPETEELVRWIASDASPAGGGEAAKPLSSHAPEMESGAPAQGPSLRILDIGTGSGAIAIALAKRLPGAFVTALDLSPDALRYARLNIENSGARVTLVEADILAPSLETGTFDLIVSNPPYIPEAEREQMAPNVTRYEPATALFVPDGDPLLFYRAIARLARRTLVAGGALYFEIHEGAASGLAELLRAEGFRQIEVRDDINSKPRMVKCRL